VTTEIPTVFEPWSKVQWVPRSDSELEALMETMPYCDPEATIGQRQLLREAVADCVDQLGDEDRWMIEAIWFERITVRELAPRLGLEKSQTHRLVTRAVVRLGDLCVQHPVLQAHFGLQVGLQSSA